MPPDELNHFRELVKQWQDSHMREHKLLKEALDLALLNMNGRLTEMNNFRDQIREERSSFVTWPALAAVIMGHIALLGLLIAYFTYIRHP